MVNVNSKLHEIIKDKDTQKQFIKYLLVGGSTALIELMLYTLFRKVIHLELALSNIFATICATTFNFIVNRGWSFKAASNLSRSLIMYLILFCFNTIFSTFMISYMVNWGLYDVMAKVITMGIITMWNFLLYRKLIFK